jgi:NifU-like protein involved in Fe-S cluster formation
LIRQKKITEDKILTELDGLPKSKRNCAKLSIKALQKAISEYEKLKVAQKYSRKWLHHFRV